MKKKIKDIFGNESPEILVVDNISAKATADQVSQLTDGKVDAAGFMRLIKDSIETL